MCQPSLDAKHGKSLNAEKRNKNIELLLRKGNSRNGSSQYLAMGKKKTIQTDLEKDTIV